MDSVPLAMPTLNWDPLQKLDKLAAPYLLHAYQGLTAIMLRHVRHPEVPVHCDGASDVKLLSFACAFVLFNPRGEGVKVTED